MQITIKNNKSLSPRSLPKLNYLRSSKPLKETSPELGIYSNNTSGYLFQELERKLLEQQKEILNRDTAVKKVIYNFEHIIEAHNDQRAKNSELKGKYLKLKKELAALKEENLNLTETLAKGPENMMKDVEEKLKSKIDTLNFHLEKKNAEIKDKQNLVFALETENDALKREINKILSQNKTIKEDSLAKYTNTEVKNLVEKNFELEKDLKNKDEELKIAHNQILYFKESSNILNAELKTVKFNMNNLKKTYFKLKEGNNEDEDTRGIKKSISRPPEDFFGKSLDGRMFFDHPESEKAMEDKLKLLKDIQDLSDTVMKLKENDMLQVERLKYLEKELTSQKDLASSYKKKFEEISVELSLMAETLIYKDEKIKRDGERLRYYKSIEPEFAILRKNNRELEETCKHLRQKADRIFDTTTKEKEKWLTKEHSYYETINTLVKELNSFKNKEESSLENNSMSKVFEFENEIKTLRKDLEAAQKNEESFSERNKELQIKLEHIVFLLNQASEILKCSSCLSIGKTVGLIVPCMHLTCKDCNASKCKECYASVHSVIHPGFVESFLFLLTQVKTYCKTKEEFSMI